jgi:hypothetical protein
LPLIVLGSVAALLHAPFGPATQAAVPNLAGEADLAWANGTLAAASNVGQLAGPAVGGVLYAAVGAGPAFAANAVSFAISATLVAIIRGQFRGKHPAASDSGAPSSSIWAGARFLWHNTTLLGLSFGFAGFLVGAAGWGTVYLGGGLIDVACAAVLAVILRRRVSHPARPPLSAEAQSSGKLSTAERALRRSFRHSRQPSRLSRDRHLAARRIPPARLASGR